MTYQAPYINATGRVYFSIDDDVLAYARADFVRRLFSHRLTSVIATIGCYDGEIEHSWSVDVDEWNRVVRFDDALAGQESFLHVDDDTSVATLIFNDTGEGVEIGVWTRVDEATAKARLGWTYIPRAREYFTAL